MIIHNGADEVVMICVDHQQQHRKAPIRVYAEYGGGGANRAQAKVAVPFRGAMGAPSYHQ